MNMLIVTGILLVMGTSLWAICFAAWWLIGKARGNMCWFDCKVGRDYKCKRCGKQWQPGFPGS